MKNILFFLLHWPCCLIMTLIVGAQSQGNNSNSQNFTETILSNHTTTIYFDYVVATTNVTDVYQTFNESDIFIVKPPEIYRAVEGETISFECIPNKSLSARQVWHIPPQTPFLTARARLQRVISGVFFRRQNFVMTIQRVRLIYAGEYQCTIFVNGKAFSTKLTLEVVISHTPINPKIVFTIMVVSFVFFLSAILFLYFKMEHNRALFYKKRKRLKEQQVVFSSHF